MSSFAADISEFCSRTKIKGSLVMRKLALEGFEGILLRSPVNTGRFRASNRVSINHVDSSVEPAREGPSGPKFAGGLTGGELTGAVEKLARVDWGDTIHLTNSLPYAKALEGGHSAQNGHKPDGIYGDTFNELAANVERLVRQVREES